MAINFPNSPLVNDVFTDTTSGYSYQWDGSIWKNYTYQRISPASAGLLIVYGRSENTEILLNIPDGGVSLIYPTSSNLTAEEGVTSSLFA